MPVAAHASANTSQAIIDTVADISCHQGYVFADMTSSQVTECDRYSKLWTVTPGDCLREFLLFMLPLLAVLWSFEAKKSIKMKSVVVKKLLEKLV